ncbi:MAG TPA: glycosyltransferase family 2 protein [Dehalococcoidia bacterium]|nr:glycosyltransferase family 2 protein [Dehalococcoidia bacterium]
MTVEVAQNPASASGANHFVSIVMPCLNEKETVEICVRKALTWLDRSGTPGEVLVVDNGSTDGSPELARNAGARVVFEPVKGYGSALRRGFVEAQGDWLVMGDCDDTYEFGDLDPLMAPLYEGADMSIGNRHAGGIAPGAMTWSHRYIGTPTISFLLKMFTGLKVGDSQCGLRAFTRGALDRMELKTDGMELASEMILKAARRGLNVAEVPVPYAERLGEAKLNTFRDGWRHLRFLMLASPNYMFTIPGIVLLIAGAIILTASVPNNEIQIGDWTWQPVFAGSIFAVVGFNAFMLGFASRMYTSARGITNEDAFVRFYRRYLNLEVFVAIGFLLILTGIVTDAVLLATDSAEDHFALSAVAQTLIIIGANAGLVGALASLLDDGK